MKKLMALVVVLSLIIVGAAIASVVSSKHDIRVYASANGVIAPGSTGKTNQVCVFCHHPHRQNATGTDTILLWNNDMFATVYTTYTSPTANSAANMGGTLGATAETQYSRLCMGCHDGNSGVNTLITAPVDVTAGAATTKTLTGKQADIGGDTGNLTNDHPVDFTYPASIDASDDINVSGQASNKINGTFPLYSGTMQCATCHGVHMGTDSQDPKVQFMRKTTVDSAICISCHTSK